jgi:hypothetical protein
MLHKQIVFAAIAVTALMGLIVPLTAVPAAHAQVDANEIVQGALDSVFGGDDAAAEDDGGDGVDQSGDDNQNLEQTNEQNQEAEQEVDQENDQSEENTQSNELNTGDNTATVTQANAAEQAVEAAAAAESGDAEAEAEDESKHKKDHHYSSSTTADAESIATATAEATGLIDQDNVAAVEQDSSANDNVLANVNEFGDDENTQVAVPIIDQDQTAENRAVNLDFDDEYGNVVDGGGDGGDDADLRACLLLPPGQIRACIEAL